MTLFFQQKRPPEKFTLEKFTSQNSHRKIHPRIRAEKFTLHFCRAILLTRCGCASGLHVCRHLLQARSEKSLSVIEDEVECYVGRSMVYCLRLVRCPSHHKRKRAWTGQRSKQQHPEILQMTSCSPHIPKKALSACLSPKRPPT